MLLVWLNNLGMGGSPAVGVEGAYDVQAAGIHVAGIDAAEVFTPCQDAADVFMAGAVVGGVDS